MGDNIWRAFAVLSPERLEKMSLTDSQVKQVKLTIFTEFTNCFT